MENQAAYILMGAYIVLFAVLFVCVFGAILYMGREQSAGEHPAVAAAERQPAAVRAPVVMADAVVSGAAAITTAGPAQMSPAG